MTDRRRALPSVDRLLRAPAVAAAGAGAPREVLAQAVRAALAAARAKDGTVPDGEDAWARAIAAHLEEAQTPTLRRVVNATGVVLHTNLGRAPLARTAIAAALDAGTSYSTLEYDVEQGARGSRHVHCAGLIKGLTGAEDALVVNNAASALLLVLAAAAEGGAVVVSRGELIEIGGGFRIPEIMEKSGATLVEVGTTNRTRVADYEKALGGPAGRRTAGRGRSARPPVRPSAILKVHRSNFKLEGFTAEASLEDLVALGRKRRVPVLYDLGGGLMIDLSDVGLADEPTLPGGAKSGAAAVVASGDKLLGGPQAGIIAGSARLVAACRNHPLARAARADKLTLAALAATLMLYRDPAAARREIPVLRMLTARTQDLETRARALLARLPVSAQAVLVTTRAAVGGGAFPGVELESRGVALAPGGTSPDTLATRLRRRAVPVVAFVRGGRVVIDVRTLLEGDEDEIVAAAEAALNR
ncbi:MAG: L-seryl-tRNA(Sec) selenium transferase [Gemmatimonadales bacterium]